MGDEQGLKRDENRGVIYILLYKTKEKQNKTYKKPKKYREEENTIKNLSKNLIKQEKIVLEYKVIIYMT